MDVPTFPVSLRTTTEHRATTIAASIIALVFRPTTSRPE